MTEFADRNRFKRQMFQAPPRIEATIFARLPEEYRQVDPNSGWVRGQPGGPCHPVLEGPVFDLDQNLWCVDVPSGRIFRVSPRGAFELIVQYDGWPNGLQCHPDGRIFVADHKHGIMVLDPQKRRIEPFLEHVGIERFKAINDLFFARNGDLYFTDQGFSGLDDPTGRVFRVSPAGDVTCLIDNVPSPNGLVMDLEEANLYVAATRANAIWRLPLTRSGHVVKAGTFIQLSGGGGPDGLALDRNGSLFVTHVGLGCVWAFDRFGEPQLRIQSPIGRLTTNCAFGGENNASLFITEGGDNAAILVAKLETPGVPSYLQASQP